MISVKKLAMIILIAAAVIALAVIGARKYSARPAFSGEGLKIVLDAGHGAYV